MAQKVRYRTSAGDVAGRDNATILDESQIVDMARSVSSLPPGLFVGIGKRETSLAANEIDQDLNSDGSVADTTYGYLQLGHDGVGGEQDLDPQQCTIDGHTVFSGYLTKILAAANLDEPTRDCWAYVCWAHNAGINDVLPSIAKYGLDWQATIDRNTQAATTGNAGALYMTQKMIPYANAVLDYVDQYPAGDSSSDDSSGGGTDLGLLLLLLGGAVAYWMVFHGAA